MLTNCLLKKKIYITQKKKKKKIPNKALSSYSYASKTQSQTHRDKQMNKSSETSMNENDP